MKRSYIDSLAHSTWKCKYHIVFARKYRRKEIYGKIKQEIGMILRELCRRKEVEIINADAYLDHIHMYVSTVGNNKTAVYRYVENQLKEDMMTAQLTLKEYKDPFKGSK